MAIRCSLLVPHIASPSLPIAHTHCKSVIRKGPDDPCPNGQKLRLMIQPASTASVCALPLSPRIMQKCISPPAAAAPRCTFYIVIPPKPFIILLRLLASAKTKVFAPFGGNISWRGITAAQNSLSAQAPLHK